MLKSKISLGTAQFGQNYGIANKQGVISKDEIFKILDYAFSVGVHYLDTASTYGLSESVIGEYVQENPNVYHVISKLPALVGYNSSEIENLFSQSLKRLNLDKLYGYLIHRIEDVFADSDVWDSLVNLKKSGKVNKIGISLYNPSELVILLDKKINFDIVQLPYSVFDRRFEKYFDILKKEKVEIQARSVFLQGLAFLNVEELPPFFQEAKSKLELLNRVAREQDISVASICLNFTLLNHHVDKVLIGVDNLGQFKKTVSSIQSIDCVKKIYAQLKDVEINTEDILLPYKWDVNC